MDHRLTSSLHVHTGYCDGRGSVGEIVEAALSTGLAEIGITSHAPLPFDTTWTMPLTRIDDYVREVREAERCYEDRIPVRLGLEIDFIPDADVAQFQDREIHGRVFDYFVGSIHFLGAGYPPQSYEGDPNRFRAILSQDYGGDIKAMVEDYYGRVTQMVGGHAISVVGHLDRIKRWNDGSVFFDEDETWYRNAVEATLEAIAMAGTIVELNTSGWRKGHDEPYPAIWILERCREHGIPVLVTADAHDPTQLTCGFDLAVQCLDELGIAPTRSLQF
ncbi:MAG: histidinol-phosphatase [Chloroflexota bacterium]